MMLKYKLKSAWDFIAECVKVQENLALVSYVQFLKYGYQ